MAKQAFHSVINHPDFPVNLNCDMTSHSICEDQKRHHSYQQQVQICMNAAIEHKAKTITSLIQAELYDMFTFNWKCHNLR